MSETELAGLMLPALAPGEGANAGTSQPPLDSKKLGLLEGYGRSRTGDSDSLRIMYSRFLRTCEAHADGFALRQVATEMSEPGGMISPQHGWEPSEDGKVLRDSRIFRAGNPF